MAVISGSFFSVKVGTTDIPQLAAWTIEYTLTPAQYVGADTRGGVRRLCGPKQWRGTLSGFGTPPSLLPGDGVASAVTLVAQFYTSWATTPPPAATGVSGDIVITSVSVGANFEENSPVQWQIGFEGNSDLTEGNVSVGLPSLSAPVCAVDTSVQKDAQTVADVLEWQLVLAESLGDYRSSTTGNVVKHVRGPKDAQAQVVLGADGFAALPAIGAFGTWKFQVSASDFFEVKFMEALTHAVDMRRGEKIGRFRVPLAWSTHDASGTLGYIKRNTTQWHP